MKHLLLPVLLLMTLVTPVGAAPAAAEPAGPQAAPSTRPRYTITDLGTLGGATTKGYGINESGQIVGASQIGSYMHAFLWDDGTMTNLGALGAYGSWAHDINDAGQVVGESYVGSEFYTHGFLWENGAMQDLGTLGGPESLAFGINNAGQVAGKACCAPDSYVTHAVRWGGGIVDLGDLDPEWPNHSVAYGINDVGQIVGQSATGDPLQLDHAFLWQNGSMQDMGTLGGDLSGAWAINENGQAVGYSKLANSTTFHAVLWDGGRQDLGALTFTNSIAYDINDKKQVVGALKTGQISHAFVWANGQMQDLNNLVAANSGWVLQEAHAINNKGQIVGFGTINGQTRAFLLKPSAYHWANPSGGAWHLTTNWDPRGDPGAGDTVIFDLSGQYTVDASTLAVDASPARPPQLSVDRLIVASTNFVYFDNMDLNMVYDSPEEPSLTVNAGGTAAVNSGAATFSHAIIGGEPPANPNNPPLARLQVLGNSASLNGTGRLTIGDEGAGELLVTAGGELTSAEARIGGVLPTGTGVADVGGDGSQWDTGNIAVGYGMSGTLTIQYGGRVNSNDAYVSYGALSEKSLVTVDGISANTNQPAMWALTGDLFIGQSSAGFIEVLNGADLVVNKNVYIKNDGSLAVKGRHPNNDPSDLYVLESVFVGGPGSGNTLALLEGAKGEIGGNLIIGQDGSGVVVMFGHTHLANPTELDVVDSQAGLCVIGQAYDGGMALDDAGLLHCQNIQLGQPGMSGTGMLNVDGGIARALDLLTVGQVGGGRGVVMMTNRAIVASNNGTYITANGVISGTGTLVVGPFGLLNEGTLAPGITVQYPRAAPGPSRAPAATATLAITGTLTMRPSGRVEIPLIGDDPGQYGSVAATGAAVLDGVLALNFQQGYAPRQGDIYTFLSAASLSGAFDSVAISGLAPGFQYQLINSSGRLKLKALNNGVPTSGPPPRRIFLPLVRR